MVDVQKNDQDMRRSRPALGRGLSSLIPQIADQVASETIGLKKISPAKLIPNRDQPRQHFDEDRLTELANSIKEHGLLQPLLVRQIDGDRYEIVAGERRWRAAKKAGIEAVPCVVTEIADRSLLTVALVENLQRQDLNAIEEAESYKKLVEDMGFSQDQVAKAVGKDRSTIANSLRLLKLPGEIVASVVEGVLSMGHARALLGLQDNLSMVQLAQKTKDENLSVRQVERLVKQSLEEREEAQERSKERRKMMSDSAVEREIRRQLEHLFGTKVDLRQHQGRGMIAIHFDSVEQLNGLLAKFHVNL